MNVVVHIPNQCPAVCWVKEQIIWMSIQVKIRHGHHFSARQKSRTRGSRYMNVVVHIPNLCPACCWVEEEVIWMSIQVKIRRGHHFSARQKSGPERGADPNVIIKIHYARLCCAGIVHEIIWVAAAVELGGRNQIPTAWRRCWCLKQQHPVRSTCTIISRRYEIVAAAVRKRRVGDGHKRVCGRIVPTCGHRAAKIVQCDSQCMAHGRVNHRQLAIRSLGRRRVIVPTDGSSVSVSAVSCGQQRVSLVRNKVIPRNRCCECLEIPKFSYALRIQMRLPTT